MDLELVNVTSGILANCLSALSVYFSIVTAYVIAAFMAGSRLTRLQLGIITTSFSIAAGILGMLSVLLFRRFVEIAGIIQQTAPSSTPLIDFSFPLTALILIVYLGCLVFMWSVRRQKQTDSSPQGSVPSGTMENTQ